MALEDIPHSLVTDSVPRILQGTRDAAVAPRAVLLYHAPPMPREKRVELHDTGHIYEGQLP
jgi:hypothetical protein